MLTGPPRRRRVPRRNWGSRIDDLKRIPLTVGGRLPGVAVNKIVNDVVTRIEQANLLAIVIQRIGVGPGDVNSGSISARKLRQIFHHHDLGIGRQIDVPKQKIHARRESESIQINR